MEDDVVLRSDDGLAGFSFAAVFDGHAGFSTVEFLRLQEELRNYILTEVAQSDIVSQAGSKNLKPGQLSDAVYQDLSKKLTGRISDEIWKVIMSDSINDDISETVESAYSRILNPTAKDVGHHSSSSSSAKVDTRKRTGVYAAPTEDEANVADKSELQMPPGFDISKNKDVHREHLLHLPSEEELHNAMNMVDDDDDMPPGFAIPLTSAGAVKVSPGISTLAAAAADMHLGVGTSGDVDVDTPPSFSTGAGSGGGAGNAGADAEEDDTVAPPGFGRNCATTS